MSEPKRSPTIVDVADMADVSIGTVSRYLNGFQIKEINRKRVVEAIDKLSYSRNAFASAMKSQASNMVGLLVPDYDEFHAQLLGNLVTTLRKEQLVTLTYCHESNAEGIRDALDFFRTHRVAALIVSHIDLQIPAIQAMMSEGVEIITYDNDPIDNSFNRVVVNNRKITAEAVGDLIAHGHQRIGIVTGTMENWTAQERLAGYHDALTKSDIGQSQELVFHGNWLRNSGESAMDHFVALPEPPTAIFCSNHQMSIGLLARARDSNLTIPADMSLVSFDDVEVFQHITPPISAIKQPVALIADAIKQLVVKALRKKVHGKEVIILPCEYLPRQSVAQPRSHKLTL